MINPVPNVERTITVKPGDVISEAQLFPARGLVTLDADAVRVEGGVAAPAETQLMWLKSRIYAACTFSFPQKSMIQRFLFGAQDFTCFADEDADGRFESAFRLSSSRIGVPPPYGQIPIKRIPIQPVAYRARSLSEGSEFPRLFFKYSHRDQITGYAYLGICIGNSTTEKQTCFDGYHGIRNDKLPKEIRVAGNVVEAIEKDNERVKIVVRRGFEVAPFVGEERTVWYFF